MVHPTDATLHAIVRGAIEATGASHGWLLANDGDGLRVVAVSGEHPAARVGDTHGTTGSYGYVVSSGQPLALQPQAGRNDPWTETHPLIDRVPTSICSVPCEGIAALVGVLEVVDKTGGGFSFDDVEVVTLLGGIAGAALDAGTTDTDPTPDPVEIADELSSLRDADPTQYRRVASLIEVLLANV